MSNVYPTQHPGTSIHKLAIVLFLLALSQLAAGAIANTEQSFQLNPGWNAIYVELEPANNQIEDIFAGVPVESVWRWIPQAIGQDFIQDPAEGLMSIDGWYGYFPEPLPEAFLTNLYTISANTAYLVKLSGNTSRTVTISGQPVYRKTKWRSDSFTLTGLGVQPGNEPTFGDFFAGSQAHANQPVYTLTSAGQWQLVQQPQTTVIESGKAYWIYTQGASTFQGLLDITLQQGDSLEYRTVFTELDFVISNLSDVTNFISINRLGGVSLPMKFLNVDPETNEEAWPDLPVTRVLELAPGEDVFVKLAVDRLSFTEERMEQVFSITNEQGARLLLHAGGNTIQPLALPAFKTPGNRGVLETPDSLSGLWIGTVRVTGVSEAQTAGVTPEPVGKPFLLRVIMHVDANGQVRLLKNVVQMWQDGTYTTSDTNPDFLEVDTPGYYVLLTDQSLIPNYSGVTLRGGQSAGIRYSTVAYDFPGDELEMTGELALNGALQVTVLTESDMPTNPFLHKYHPDHDNLDAQFLNFKQEAYQVTREMQFSFLPNNPNYPDQADPPGWGADEMGGIYQETISGLHKNAIFIEGEFKVKRIAATPVLNQ